MLQALKPQLTVDPRYWTNEKPRHEVDYLIQIDNHILPVEVQASTNVKAPSLQYYERKYPEQTPLRVRFSQRGLSLDDGVLNIPLYLADEAVRLMRIALERP